MARSNNSNKSNKSRFYNGLPAGLEPERKERIHNVSFEDNGTELVIRIDKSYKGVDSSTGKSTLIASTGGFLSIDETMRLGINITAVVPKKKK
ncbi:MAG: hypothetical protein ACOCWC_04870 [Bacteroidota bacterium]